MGDDSPQPDLLERLYAGLSGPEGDALDRLRALASNAGISLALVGGAVRDLILGRPTIDLDLALEGEVALIAQALAAETNGRAVLHDRFGTATVSGSGFHLDLARTRSETYDRPGALPTVEPAALYADLARRDFTINALALRLTEPAGELIDPFGGLLDLSIQHIRFIHDASFQDDATRMLRAVRYAARLGFVLDAETDVALRRDLPHLDAISPARLRRELTLIFAEERAVTAIEFAEDLGILEAIHPLLRLRSLTARRWRNALGGTHHAPLDELGFCVLARPETEDDVTSLSARLHLTSRTERAMHDFVRLRLLSDKLAASAPAEVVELLDVFAPAAVWAFGIVVGGPLAAASEAYLGRWRNVRPHLSGHDLQDLGVPPGVAVGEELRELRRACLDGQLNSREDEEQFVRARLAAK